MGYLLLPHFVNTEKIDPGEIQVRFTKNGVGVLSDSNPKATFTLRSLGTATEYGWDYTHLIEPKLNLRIPDFRAKKKKVNGIEVKGYSIDNMIDNTFNPNNSNPPRAFDYSKDEVTRSYRYYLNDYEDGTRVYRSDFFFNAYGYIYHLYVEGTTPFNDLWDDFDVIVYPLSGVDIAPQGGQND
jgi:hypothetical protein